MSTERANRLSDRAAKRRNAEILDSTLASFNEHGCFQTTVDQVIAKVGIGKGTLYRHYPSRGDLFKDALRAGIDTLRGRCHDVWETYRTDPDVGFRAVISELVSLNHRREAVSPATLDRLDCGCQWMSKSDTNDGHLEAVLLLLVPSWQAVRLFEKSADPSWIAAVIMALVNSPAVINRVDGDSDVVDRVVDLLRRSFAPVSGPLTVQAP